MGGGQSKDSNAAKKGASYKEPVINGDLEEFSLEVYAQGNKFEAVKYILSDEVATKFFMDYLKSEFSAESLMFYLAVEQFKLLRSPTEITSTSATLVETYLKEGSEYEVNVSAAMKSSLLSLLVAEDLASRHGEAVRLIEIAQQEVIAMLAMNGLPRYISSGAYKKWRGDESAVASAFKHDAQPSDNPRLVEKAFSMVDQVEKELILAQGSWLKQFIAMVEILPVAVSISTADTSRRGFPLIYVNMEFERMTGFSRDSVVGRPGCKFLQSSKSEREALMQMSQALKSSQECKIDVTNFKKDGTFFRNLVCLKPILDTAGVMRYVVAVQHDITGEGISSSRNKFAESLVSHIPHTIHVPLSTAAAAAGTPLFTKEEGK